MGLWPVDVPSSNFKVLNAIDYGRELRSRNGGKRLNRDAFSNRLYRMPGRNDINIYRYAVSLLVLFQTSLMCQSDRGNLNAHCASSRLHHHYG